MLETERTMLQAPTEADYEAICRVFSNEESRAHLGGPVKPEHYDQKFKDMLTAKKPSCFWIIREKQSGECMGVVSIDLYHDGIHYELSYELLPQFWGKGFGSEVAIEVLRYGFKELSLGKIYAETQTKNLASVKLLGKIGMTFVEEIERFGEMQSVFIIQAKD